jgi:transcriptional regulator with XRE-family HTH domain
MEEVMSLNVSDPKHNDDIEESLTGTETLLLEPNSEADIVGKRLGEIRTQRGWTLKALAEQSKLNINTLTMIEKGKSSPSVGTLQRISRTLDVPITALFEVGEKAEQIIFTAHDHRPETTCCEALIQNLGKDLKSSAIEPFIVTMQPHAGSGGRTIIHSGYEFAYCMSGKIIYRIEEMEYPMAAGDSLVFAAKLPHRWENAFDGESQMMLVLTPGEQFQSQGDVHFHGK